MPEIGITGLIVILVVALLVFGPKRLPEIGRSLGQWNARVQGLGHRRADEKAELPASFRRRVPASADVGS